MHKHCRFEKHRLLQGFEQVGEYQERFTLQLPQYPQLGLPTAHAQLSLRESYSLASRIAPAGKGKRISLSARQHKYENFRLSAHRRNELEDLGRYVESKVGNLHFRRLH